MASLSAAEPVALTAHEALSGITGSISLASWIFVMIPQLIENFRQGSADGVSLAFLAVWFIGDITNLAGAVWAGLVPTVIAIAIYFCFSDVVLITQCLYYNTINDRRERKKLLEQTQANENEPLLNRRNSDIVGLPSSRRRRSSATSRRSGRENSSQVHRVVEESSKWKAWVRNTVSVAGVCVVGVVGWAITWRTGLWKPLPAGDGSGGVETALGAEILGYISAICYLGARIPQIIKNYRDRSCEGLSLLFFLLSVLGNLTYGAGILFHSLERKYVLTNLPWLIGSMGTLAEDAIIFVQFHIYGDQTSAADEA